MILAITIVMKLMDSRSIRSVDVETVHLVYSNQRVASTLIIQKII